MAAVKIAAAEVFRYALPLTQSLRLGGETLDERRGLLLRLHSEAGHIAWGEAAPLPGCSREGLHDAEIALRQSAQRLPGLALGEALDHFVENTLNNPRQGATLPSVYFAVESACLDLRAQASGLPLRSLLHPASLPHITLNALLSGNETQMLARARAAAQSGYSVLKLKVGHRLLQEDLRLIQAVRAAAGPTAVLRLDANRRWDLESAVIVMRAVRDQRIEYIEEPLADPLQLPEFLAKAEVPYALDETLQHPADLLARARAANRSPVAVMQELLPRATAWVWKPTLAQRPILDAARRVYPRHPVVVSGAFESGVGIAALAQYAAAYSGPDLACGLDTYAWLADDVCTPRLPLRGGTLDADAIATAARKVNLDRLEQIA